MAVKLAGAESAASENSPGWRNLGIVMPRRAASPERTVNRTTCEAAISSADPRNPGLQPRPAIGIQFIDIPEFTDLGTQVSQYVSSSIAGQMSVDEALDRGQRLAEDVAERYQSRQQ